jgi:hypothetical protein
MILPTIIANLTTTGCAILLLRRGPSRRLRLLTLAVGLMSLSQTVAWVYSHSFGTDTPALGLQVHQALVACLSLLAIYLLGSEIYDRNYTDRKLRLLEHDTAIVQPTVQANAALIPLAVTNRAGNRRDRRAPAVPEAKPRFFVATQTRIVDVASVESCAFDLIQLIQATGDSVKPVVTAQWQGGETMNVEYQRLLVQPKSLSA